MLKDFEHWLSDSIAYLGVMQREEKVIAPNLMRSVEQLEDDLYQRVARNLYPVDVARGQDYHSAVMKILMLRVLPDEYASSPPWQYARQLYSQIEALKGSPEAVMWLPV